MHHLSLFILAVCAAATPNNPLKTNIDYNLDAEGPRAPYNNSAIQRSANWLDVYAPAQDGTARPIVLYVHGGGWMVGDKSQTHFKDELFTDAGFVFISMEYRLSPAPIDRAFPLNRVRSPEHVEDVAEAIRWIVDNAAQYGGDGTKITLLGHSAGAQIISLVATDPSYLQARGVSPSVIRGVVALDGAAYDVTQAVQDSIWPSMHLQAFGTYTENSATGSWNALSATNFADAQDPPFLLVTQRNKPDRVAQCVHLSQALHQNSRASILPVNKTHGHINTDLGNPADTSIMTAKVLAFVHAVGD